MFTRRRSVGKSAGRTVVVFPRESVSRAMIGVPSRIMGPVEVTYDFLLSKRSFPLCDVAYSLGLSLSATKKAARRLGIKNWTDFRKDSRMDPPGDGDGPCDPTICVCGHHYTSLDFNRLDFRARIAEMSDFFSNELFSKTG